MPIRQAGQIGTFIIGFVFLLSAFAIPASAQLTVAGLGADLGGTCAAEDMTSFVSAAQNEGMSDEQIANAFGRASTVSTCPDTLLAAYQSFASSSDADSDALTAAYNAGVDTGNRAGIGGGGGGAGGDDGFNPPSGGSGGGAGSTNE